MKILVTKTEEIHLDKSQQRDVTVEYLEDRYQIDRNMYVEDGNLIEEKKYNTGNTWYDQEIVRIATTMDKAILEVIRDLIRDRL